MLRSFSNYRYPYVTDYYRQKNNNNLPDKFKMRLRKDWEGVRKLVNNREL